MEGNHFAVITVNSGSSNDRAAKITADVFYNCFGIAKIRFCINIESLFVVIVTSGFYLLERRADFHCHFIQEGSTESVAQKCVIEMFYMAPKPVVTKTTFGNEAVDMRIPFQISAECM
jgi:hypothetical protein